MYNQDIKMRYIKEKEHSATMPDGYLPRLFNKTEKFENKLNKDASCFTAYEIVDMYKTINTPSVETLNVLNNHLSMYTNWCLQQSLVPDCQNHYLELDTEILLKCINSYAFKSSIITRETLYNWIDSLVNPSDAFCLLALFEGIKGQEFCEIVNLKMSDFNGNKVKLCTGREIEVSDKLIELAKDSDATLEYYSTTETQTKIVPLLDDGYIVKGQPNCLEDTNDFQKGRRIYRKVWRVVKLLGVNKYMKPNSFVESGKIDYILNRVKEEDITPKQFLYDADKCEEFKNKFDITNFSDRKKYYLKYKDFFE